MKTLVVICAILACFMAAASAGELKQNDVVAIRQVCDYALGGPAKLEDKTAIGQYCQDLIARAQREVQADQQAAQAAKPTANPQQASPVAPPTTPAQKDTSPEAPK